MKLKTTIEKLSHDGRGISRINGKATFIANALPHEEVEFKYIKHKSKFDEAYATNIIKESKYRANPFCSHYKTCGGCVFQHLKSSEQLKEKETIFLDILKRFGATSPEIILPPLISESLHYRNRARFSVYKNNFGFHSKNNPKEIINLQECPILNKNIENQFNNIHKLLEVINENNSITQFIAVIGDENKPTLFFNNNLDKYQKIIEDFEKRTALYIAYPGKDLELTYTLTKENISFLFHPNDFIQNNITLNNDMIELTLKLLEPKKSDLIIDLFCGLGNFSLPIAKYVKKVIGVEGVNFMTNRAYKNAALNNITNVEFICKDLSKDNVLKSLNLEKADKLILDPPRTGALNLVKQIEVLSPKIIIYISCSPATFARDASILIHEKKYHLKKAGVIDMFPHTKHIESIAMLEKK